MNHPLRALFVARCKQTVREPGIVLWVFALPLLLALSLGLAFRMEGSKGVVAVLDGPEGDGVAAALERDARYKVVRCARDEATRQLRAGRVLVVVEPTPERGISYLFDPRRGNAAAARLAVDDTLQRAAGRTDVLAERDVAAPGRGGRYVDWLIPGLLGSHLMTATFTSLAYGLAQARQRRLLKRLSVTPMRRVHYLLAALLTRLLLITIEVPVLLGFARVVFGVTVQGSIAAVAVTAVVGTLGFGGLGLLIGARVDRSEAVSGLVSLVSMPMYVLSGVFFSSERFPQVIGPVIRALPLTALNDALRMVVNDGAPLSAVAGRLGIVAAWGVGALLVGVRAFRWT